jgi:N-acetylgalactosamine kinase
VKLAQFFLTEFSCLHAFTEANRVKTFREVCQKDMEASAALSKLGELMGQSHESLRNLYECSHPNLDKLVQLGKGKALGSRLTGAG